MRGARRPLRGALEEAHAQTFQQRERGFFIDKLLVQFHFIIELIWWTVLAPWEFGFPDAIHALPPKLYMYLSRDDEIGDARHSATFTGVPRS